MTSYDRAQEIKQALTDAGIYAVTDIKSVDGSTVVVTPPDRVYNVACGYTANWQLMAVVDGPGNAEAWQQLDELMEQVEQVLTVETAENISYQDRPALLIRMSEII